jgi:hypothetical protein
MKKWQYITIIAVFVIALVTALTWKLWTHQGPEINIEFNNNGFKVKSARVFINNLAKGGKAEISYRVLNITRNAIAIDLYNEFNIDPENDSELKGKGYIAVPSYYSDWIDLPTKRTIETGKEISFTMIIKIPKNTLEVIPPKWAFITVLSSNAGGFLEVSPGIIVVITMR